MSERASQGAFRNERLIPRPWPHPVWPPPAPPPEPPVEQHLPILATPDATLLTDRYDPNLDWAVSIPTLSAQVTDFSFAAIQDGVTAQGTPYNHATLSVTLTLGDSSDVAAARLRPGVTVQPVPAPSLTVLFTLPWTADDGTAQSTDLTATTAMRDDGAMTVTVALLGPQVIQAARALMDSTSAPCGLTLTTTYQAWRDTRVYRSPEIDTVPIRIQRITPTQLALHEFLPMSAS